MTLILSLLPVACREFGRRIKPVDHIGRGGSKNVVTLMAGMYASR